MPASAVRAVRGAIQLDVDEREHVLSSTRELVSSVLAANSLTKDDVISIMFTATPDVRSEFPAVAARELGLTATELSATRPNAVPVQLQVPLKGLAPGRYTCQLNVIDEVGRKFAFPRQALVVQ